MAFKFPEKYRVKEGNFASKPESTAGLASFQDKGLSVVCVASIDEGWEHVSVTCAYPGKKVRFSPSWDLMCKVKNMFWEEEDLVCQIHPPKSRYVDLHPYCLHLWRPVNGEFRFAEINQKYRKVLIEDFTLLGPGLSQSLL